MATETLGFNDKEMRDEHYLRWKAEGSFGLARYSTHQGNDPQIIYVVTRAEPVVSCLQIDKLVQESIEKNHDLLELLADGDTNDGQDSLHVDSGNIRQPEQDILSEGRNPAEGNPEGKNNPDFRDWSA